MATFGIDPAETGDNNNGEIPYYCDVSKFVMNAENGTGTKMSLRCYNANGITQTRCVIYADNAGAPGALVGYTDIVTLPSAVAWQDFPFTVQPALTSGTTYWLGFLACALGTTFFRDNNNAAQDIIYKNQDDTTPDDPYGAGATYADHEICVYVTYTPAGGGGGAVGGGQGFARELTLTMHKPFSKRFPVFKPRLVA